MECEQHAEYVFVMYMYMALTSSAEYQIQTIETGFFATFFRPPNKVSFELINESCSFSDFALLFRW